MNVILIGANFDNKGAEAMIYSTKWILDKFIGNTQITVITKKSNKYFKTISIGYIFGVSYLIIISLINKIPFIPIFLAASMFSILSSTRIVSSGFKPNLSRVIL